MRLSIGCLFSLVGEAYLSRSWPEDRMGYDEHGNDPIRSEVHQLAAVRMRLGVQKLRARI